MSNPRPLIVIVHDEDRILAALDSLLSDKEYQIITFHSLERSLGFIRRNSPEIVLARRPESVSEGLDYLEHIKEVSSCTEGIFLPCPLVLDDAGAVRADQAHGILRIVERLLQFRRVETRSFRIRTVGV